MQVDPTLAIGCITCYVRLVATVVGRQRWGMMAPYGRVAEVKILRKSNSTGCGFATWRAVSLTFGRCRSSCIHFSRRRIFSELQLKNYRFMTFHDYSCNNFMGSLLTMVQQQPGRNRENHHWKFWTSGHLHQPGRSSECRPSPLKLPWLWTAGREVLLVVESGWWWQY